MNTIKESKEILEAKRIEVLRRYEILDTPPDVNFDNLTRMAAELLEMPIAAITFVDKDRIWVKSRVGIDVQELKRSHGFCSDAILGEDFFLVENAEKDKRTCDNPLVTGEFNLRFYYGIPLKSKEGYNLGTLCVIDKNPRNLTQHQKAILSNLADLVVSQIESQLEVKTAVKHHHNILNITAHDLKNPLSIMPLLADMVLMNKENPDAIDDIARQIKSAGKRMNKILDDLLDAARDDIGRIQLRLKKVNYSDLIKGVVATNSSLARNKNQILKLNIQEGCEVYGDHQRLSEIVDNLINNAIKYSPYGKDIFISLSIDGKKAVLEVRDEGPGLTKDDLKNLFRKFTSLSAEPTGGESSSGLGLSIVKHFVTAHRGDVYAKCEGAGMGSTFIVELPISEK